MTTPVYTLKPNSIPGEYYCGDLPGNLQYKKDLHALAAIAVPTTDTSVIEWEHLPCSNEYRAALLPHTKKPDDWTLIMVMKKVDTTRGVWMKGALLNKATRAVALLTTCDSVDIIHANGNRAIQSCADGWFVGHYRMGAPLCFWEALSTVCKQYTMDE